MSNAYKRQLVVCHLNPYIQSSTRLKPNSHFSSTAPLVSRLVKETRIPTLPSFRPLSVSTACVSLQLPKPLCVRVQLPRHTGESEPLSISSASVPLLPKKNQDVTWRNAGFVVINREVEFSQFWKCRGAGCPKKFCFSGVADAWHWTGFSNRVRGWLTKASSEEIGCSWGCGSPIVGRDLVLGWEVIQGWPIRFDRCEK